MLQERSIKTTITRLGMDGNAMNLPALREVLYDRRIARTSDPSMATNVRNRSLSPA
jgi:hypothetical protein